jgi:uncharacterized membrane protein YoaK (UPF0700 family)
LRTQSANVRGVLVTVLAFTAGFIDAVSLLGFGVFASVMTGNTIIFGLGIARGEPLSSALRSAVAIAAYMLGVAVGTSIADSTQDRQGRIWPSGATNAFVLEFLGLLSLAVGGVFVGSAPSSNLVYGLIALAAVSMGLQSAGFNALGISGASTTRITGTYENFVIDLYRWRRSSTLKTAREKRSDAGLQAIVVLVYVLAAIAGGLAEIHLSSDATLIPAIILGVMIIVTRTRTS